MERAVIFLCGNSIGTSESVRSRREPWRKLLASVQYSISGFPLRVSSDYSEAQVEVLHEGQLQSLLSFL